LHGGVETTLKLLALEPELCPEMDQNIALCFEGRLTREISSAAHRVHLLGAARLGNPWSTRRARAALTKLLTAQHFDRAITHSPWGQVMFGPVLRKAAIHTTLWLHDLPDGKHWLQRWARFQPPDFVLCNSRFTQSVLQNLYPQVPAGYMYPPVVNGTHGFSPTNRDAIRAELNLPKDLTVIIQVGRMEPFKGHGFMLEALSHLRDVHGWICLIVGGIQREKDGEYMRNLQARAVSLGISNQVRFMGEREDVSRLLVASDIYAQGNIGPEPFGITFIEALYAGLPVVTPAMGGALEIVTSDCGILVPPGQAVIFGQALKALIGDPEWRSHLSSAARKRAKLLCDPVRQAHQLYEILASDQG
jgi:glycosyltransferase involved in cell wall biosynthesis